MKRRIKKYSFEVEPEPYAIETLRNDSSLLFPQESQKLFSKKYKKIFSI